MIKWKFYIDSQYPKHNKHMTFIFSERGKTQDTHREIPSRADIYDLLITIEVLLLLGLY